MKLLKLPLLALVCVLKLMESPQVIRISNLSKRCNRIVKAVKLRTKVLELKICTLVEIVTDIPGMCKITLRNSHEFSNHLDRNQFQLRAFFDDFMELFRYQKIGLVFNFMHPSYPVRAVKMAMNGLEIQSLRITNQLFRDDYIIEILDNFMPVKCLELIRNPYGKTRMHLFRNVLKKEYEILELGQQIFVKLGDLLVINSSQLIIQSSLLTVPQMNNLLKRWTKGWNSNMTYMYITVNYAAMDDIPEILRQMNHQQVMEDRRIVAHNKIEREFKVGTAYEIEKEDGTKGTLYFRECTRDIDIYFTII